MGVGADRIITDLELVELAPGVTRDEVATVNDCLSLGLGCAGQRAGARVALLEICVNCF